MHPPTYEIFTMISKVSYQTIKLSFHQKFDDFLLGQVVLLSCGRLMYFGKRREMLPYFAFIE